MTTPMWPRDGTGCWWCSRWAFLPLVVGPLVGTAAMLRLRVHPAATALAGGRR